MAFLIGCGSTRRLQPAPGRGGSGRLFLFAGARPELALITIERSRCRMSPPCCGRCQRRSHAAGRGGLSGRIPRTAGRHQHHRYAAARRRQPHQTGGRRHQYGGTGNFRRQHRSFFAHRAAGVQPGNLVEHGELNATVRQNADNARRASRTGKILERNSRRAGGQVQSVVATMGSDRAELAQDQRHHRRHRLDRLQTNISRSMRRSRQPAPASRAQLRRRGERGA